MFDQQQAAVNAEVAKLEAMRPLADELRATMEALAARRHDADSRANDASAWQQQRLAECEKYKSGEWTFVGWRGGPPD